MNYERIYKELIESRVSLKRSKKDGYFERHHITPKSLGGSNIKDNIILLTAKEHFIAHRLLVKMSFGIAKAKMAYALMRMCQNNDKQSRRITSRQFDIAKREMSIHCSGKNHHSNFRWSDEAKEAIRNRQTGARNSMFGKVPWNKGATGLYKTSEDTKEKISKANIGRVRSADTREKISNANKGKSKTEEHKAKLSKANIGKVLSDETKKKMSQARKDLVPEVMQCPHCAKIGKGAAMRRWHFDQCKIK